MQKTKTMQKNKQNPCKRQKPCKKNKIHVLNVVMSLGGVHLQSRSPTLEFLSSDPLFFHPSVSNQPLLCKTLKQSCIMSSTNTKLLKSPLFPTPASRRPLSHTLNEPQAGLHKCKILHTWWNWDRFADSNSISMKIDENLIPCQTASSASYSSLKGTLHRNSPA